MLQGESYILEVNCVAKSDTRRTCRQIYCGSESGRSLLLYQQMCRAPIERSVVLLSSNYFKNGVPMRRASSQSFMSDYAYKVNILPWHDAGRVSISTW